MIDWRENRSRWPKRWRTVMRKRAEDRGIFFVVGVISGELNREEDSLFLVWVVFGEEEDSKERGERGEGWQIKKGKVKELIVLANKRKRKRRLIVHFLSDLGERVQQWHFPFFSLSLLLCLLSETGESLLKLPLSALNFPFPPFPL
ncbi:unnamed protein product [Linum tenue]|uniref:Uncharacterized protein n=1 Tax=Linum tenue TaxID=586396 RepID=A0AAV0KTH9_9ROSI|nr:unnamed protein product [Linum tenue]